MNAGMIWSIKNQKLGSMVSTYWECQHFTIKLICVLVLVSNQATCMPQLLVHTQDNGEGAYSQMITYLNKFGYLDLPESTSTLLNSITIPQDTLEAAIRKFQTYVGLEPTGNWNQETNNITQLPRCGVKDIPESENGTHTYDFKLLGSKWSTRQLTYKITKYPQKWKVFKETVDEQIQRAFDLWATVTNLNFRSTNGKPNIEISFESGWHGYHGAFDGPGNVLAHAFPPNDFGTTVHFDDDESWTIDSNHGIDFYAVAVHEFGHSLGLAHSEYKNAVMYAYAGFTGPKLKLHADDITGIQRMYGPKVKVEPNTPRTTIPTVDERLNGNNNNICTEGHLDTVTEGPDGSYYFFIGNKNWKITNYRPETGYPRLIEWDWPGLPENIDAAYYLSKYKTNVFFKGAQVWSFVNKVLVTGYPTNISSIFPGIPNDLDAAFIYGRNGKLYFFKDKTYWRAEYRNSVFKHASKPNPISKWNGVPDNLDAILPDKNGYTYFFKNGSYWRFNNAASKFQVDEADPPYPRPIGKWWFNCPVPILSLSVETGTIQDDGELEKWNPEHYGSGDYTSEDYTLVEYSKGNKIMEENGFSELCIIK